MSNVQKKGFTLIEVIVAVFIFALVASAASGIFVKMIQSYRYAKIVQRDLESAQYAMNLMAKTLRTSSIVNSTPNLVRVYDYSQQKCIEYEFNGSNLLYSSAGDGGATIDETTCATDSLTASPNLIEGSISSGTFDAIASSDLPGSEAMGKVTISMTVKSGNRDTNIQSSVSLRDYSEVVP